VAAAALPLITVAAFLGELELVYSVSDVHAHL
jgi:hypothetical protein